MAVGMFLLFIVGLVVYRKDEPKAEAKPVPKEVFELDELDHVLFGPFEREILSWDEHRRPKVQAEQSMLGDLHRRRKVRAARLRLRMCDSFFDDLEMKLEKDPAKNLGLLVAVRGEVRSAIDWCSKTSK